MGVEAGGQGAARRSTLRPPPGSTASTTPPAWPAPLDSRLAPGSFTVARRARRRDQAEVDLADDLTSLVRGHGLVLHDRLLPNGHTIVDHVVVIGGGVFVVKVEPLHGKVELRNVGKRRRPDHRLFIGSEDRTLLVAEARHCAGAVQLAVDPAGTGTVPLQPVLCFVNATWERHASALSLDGVRVTWPAELLGRLRPGGPMTSSRIVQVGEAIDAAMPPAGR
jgi:hypothetical protein